MEKCISFIPSGYYLPVQVIIGYGFSYGDLKSMALTGGVLVRYRSRKTRRVFYRAKNMSLL